MDERTEVLIIMAVFLDSSKGVELLNLSYTLYFTFEPR